MLEHLRHIGPESARVVEFLVLFLRVEYNQLVEHSGLVLVQMLAPNAAYKRVLPVLHLAVDLGDELVQVEHWRLMRYIVAE